uniref:HAT C-terminal dimerisation domain-containing protein n=1 Tax=Latimeria chalumnae TaxID=7897 RepID=H3A803_LATCH
SITNAMAKWIAANCRPINIVNDTGLRDIIQIAPSNQAYTLPSRGTIMIYINSEKTTKLVLLKDAPFVALTRDYWMSVSNHSTAHLIDAALTLQSLVPTVKHTEERHYAETCAEHFLDVAKEWNIQDKVTTFGTDNARNMIAAANCLPFEHMPCIAHSPQRSITIVLNAAGFENVLAKCRKLVGHFKHSPANSAELERQQAASGQKQGSLIQDVATRWNSTLQVVQQLFAVTATLALQKHILVVPSAAKFDKLQKLEALLEPCRYVTELLGGETYVSCSIVLPALCHLFCGMAVSDDDPAYVVWFKNSFNADLTKRKIATALDPRFKNLKCLPKSKREEVWKLILNLTLSEVSKDQQPGAQEITEAEPPKKKMNLLLATSDSEDEHEGTHSASAALDHYKAKLVISMEDCPLEQWSKRAGAYEILAKVARKYLATPATTVPCEQLFSLSGQIVNKKRAALAPENINKLVCLSSWLS